MLIPLIIVFGFAIAAGYNINVPRGYDSFTEYKLKIRFIEVFLGCSMGLQILYGLCVYLYPMYLWINVMYSKVSKIIHYGLIVIVCSIYLAYLIISI